MVDLDEVNLCLMTLCSELLAGNDAVSDYSAEMFLYLQLSSFSFSSWLHRVLQMLIFQSGTVKDMQRFRKA